jgi:hypothetical protein
MTARWSGRISASLARLHPPLKVFRHGTANRDQNGWRAFADHDADRISAFFTEETMSATLASGNAYVNDNCCVFELQGGLVHRVREYMDTTRGHRMVFDEAPLTSGYRAAGMTACLMISGTIASTARHVYLRHRSSER